MINYLDDYDLAQVTARLRGPHEDKPFVDFSSGYFQRAKHILPKQTARAPWEQRQSYFHDILDLRYAAIEHGELEFKRARAHAREAQRDSERTPALAK